MAKQDFNRPVPPTQIQSRGNGIKYALVAVVSALSTLGLVTGGFLLYRLLESRQAIAPSNTQVNGGNSTSVNPYPETLPSKAPVGSVSIQPGQFVQSALGNKARVELTAVRRIPGALDEVSVEMLIERLTDDALGSDSISVGSTTARNPITSETFRAVDFLKRSSGSVSLYSMRQTQPVEGYVVLKVPQGVNAIDIYVPDTVAFKNVPIADANQIVGGANNAPVYPSTSTSPTQDPAPVPSTPSTVIPTLPASQVPPPTAEASTAPTGNIRVQLGQFVQPAFGTKGQVELLAVKRIKEPETGSANVVNVQMRIRRLEPDRVYGADSISVGGTTARNPDTSETYKAVSYDRSTGGVSLFLMRPGASADAYVWLRVPEGVNTIDIYVPDTQAFKNVPITN